MTRHHEPARGRKEEGSALIIAALVAVILSLLGLSYLMMAQTENTIAENERNAAAALYVAEAGARLVVGWFNDPSSTGFLVPAVGAVDRTKRIFDNDNNTGTARVQNNRTMMLASVSQDVESNGRKGLPVLSGLPFIGRIFSSNLLMQLGRCCSTPCATSRFPP